MSKPAVFEATYSDLRFVKSRKVAQVTVEIPIEQAGKFVELFGTPNPASETWIALARLQSNVASIEKAREKRRFEDLQSAMQAGIRCTEPAFWRFLNEEAGEFRTWKVTDEGGAAEAVRDYCGVHSRSALNLDLKAAARWQELAARYMLWLRAPIHAS